MLMVGVVTTVEQPFTCHRLFVCIDLSIILLLLRELLWCESGLTGPSHITGLITGHMVREILVAETPYFTIRTEQLGFLR
jgi:hypothetical protein